MPAKPSSALSSAKAAPADFGLTAPAGAHSSKRRKAAQPIDANPGAGATPAFWPSTAAPAGAARPHERLPSSAFVIHQDNLITNTTDREDVDRIAELIKPGSDSHNILSADPRVTHELNRATVMFYHGKRTRGSNLNNQVTMAEEILRKMHEDANVLSDFASAADFASTADFASAADFSHSRGPGPKDDQEKAPAEAKAAKAAAAEASKDCLMRVHSGTSKLSPVADRLHVCAIVAGFSDEDLAGLSSGSRGPNWWHVMMGVTIPLSVALLEAGLPRRAYLVKPPVSASLLAKQLTLLPSMRLVTASMNFSPAILLLIVAIGFAYLLRRRQIGRP